MYLKLVNGKYYWYESKRIGKKDEHGYKQVVGVFVRKVTNKEIEKYKKKK